MNPRFHMINNMHKAFAFCGPWWQDTLNMKQAPTETLEDFANRVLKRVQDATCSKQVHQEIAMGIFMCGIASDAVRRSLLVCDYPHLQAMSAWAEEHGEDDEMPVLDNVETVVEAPIVPVKKPIRPAKRARRKWYPVKRLCRVLRSRRELRRRKWMRARVMLKVGSSRV
ncbi:uncharacterized protein LOC129600913 [Paramacrobiotus metropolitanus]|uniref:uncharacterized protein LOC129600913 n=1 Tax=Paramacrobiotus metropolitanus TaxID=2943436 RepID=UPI00244578AE|nr:uncharacterized protein LOC129600913 [Paramacrobiotus metropolitanus]